MNIVVFNQNIWQVVSNLSDIIFMEDINVGLGFRRDIADDIITAELVQPDFIEFAPEKLDGYRW